MYGLRLCSRIIYGLLVETLATEELESYRGLDRKHTYEIYHIVNVGIKSKCTSASDVFHKEYLTTPFKGYFNLICFIGN